MINKLKNIYRSWKEPKLQDVKYRIKEILRNDGTIIFYPQIGDG